MTKTPAAASITRRSLLTGAVAVGAAAASGLWLAWPDCGTTVTQDQIIDAIATTPERDIDRAIDHLLAQGATERQLLRACFHAPVLKGSDVGDVHVVMVVEAVRSLCEQVPQAQWARPVRWVVQNANIWTRDEPAAALPEPLSGDARALRQRFEAALRQPDAAQAQQAILGLYREHGINAALQALMVGACMSPTDPHRAIYAAQVARGLATFGLMHAPDMLASVARVLVRSSVPDEANTMLAGSQRAASLLLPGWDSGQRDGQASAHLAAELRSPQPEPHNVAVDLLASGIDPASVWDGLFEVAAESIFFDTGGMGLHVLTLLDALSFGFEMLTSQADRALVLMQAVAWVGKIHLAKGSLHRALEEVLEDKEAFTTRAQAMLAVVGHRDEQERALVPQILKEGLDFHDFKYLAALQALDAQGRRVEGT